MSPEKESADQSKNRKRNISQTRNGSAWTPPPAAANSIVDDAVRFGKIPRKQKDKSGKDSSRGDISTSISRKERSEIDSLFILPPMDTSDSLRKRKVDSTGRPLLLSHIRTTGNKKPKKGKKSNGNWGDHGTLVHLDSSKDLDRTGNGSINVNPVSQPIDSKQWRFIPPKNGEPHTKMMNNISWRWCSMCKKGTGCWGTHYTNMHKTHMQKTVQKMNKNNAKAVHHNFGHKMIEFSKSIAKCHRMPNVVAGKDNSLQRRTSQSSKIINQASYYGPATDVQDDVSSVVATPNAVAEKNKSLQRHTSLSSKTINQTKHYATGVQEVSSVVEFRPFTLPKKLGRSARALSSSKIVKNPGATITCPLKRVEALRATSGYARNNQGMMSKNITSTQTKPINLNLSSAKCTRSVTSLSSTNSQHESQESTEPIIDNININSNENLSPLAERQNSKNTIHPNTNHEINAANDMMKGQIPRSVSDASNARESETKKATFKLNHSQDSKLSSNINLSSPSEPEATASLTQADLSIKATGVGAYMPNGDDFEICTINIVDDDDPFSAGATSEAVRLRAEQPPRKKLKSISIGKSFLNDNKSHQNDRCSTSEPRLSFNTIDLSNKMTIEKSKQSNCTPNLMALSDKDVMGKTKTTLRQISNIETDSNAIKTNNKLIHDQPQNSTSSASKKENSKAQDVSLSIVSKTIDNLDSSNTIKVNLGPKSSDDSSTSTINTSSRKKRVISAKTATRCSEIIPMMKKGKVAESSTNLNVLGSSKLCAHKKSIDYVSNKNVFDNNTRVSKLASLSNHHITTNTNISLSNKTNLSDAHGKFLRQKCQNRAHSTHNFLARFRGKNEEIDESERRWLEAKLELSSKDFLKSVGMFSVNKLLTSSVTDLCRKFKEWLTENNRKHTISPFSFVARWQGLARTYALDRGDQDTTVNQIDESTKIPAILHEVSHLTKTIIGPGDLPIRYITVYNKDDTLFDFRINVRPSKIPNSGYGAFLTFLGARKLKEEAKKKSQELLCDRLYVESATTKALEATIGHMNMSVVLRGEDLHWNWNNVLFPITRFPLKAIIPNGKEVNIKLTPHSIHDDVKQLRDRKEIKPLDNGLGHFKIFTEEDYEHDDAIQYCSDDFGIVDLGRYGPFSKYDRKTLQELNLKDFLYEFEPAGWNFGVAENLKGCTQIIDVTDDRTGETHRLARENIPMYVNEVGHNKRLKENVISREVDDRIVHYFNYQRDPMGKGDTVELLVNYGKEYEGTRERKGYGMANITECLECDNVYTAKLRRDYFDRESIRDMIQTMSFVEIQNSLVFLENRIIEPLVHYTNIYFSNANSRSKGVREDRLLWQRKPTTRQLRTRIRLKWICEVFRKQILQLDRNKLFPLDRAAVRTMYQIVDRKRLDPFAEYGYNYFEKEVELVEMYISDCYEDILLQVSNGYGLFHAYEPQIWCEVARTLTRDLARKLTEAEFQSSSNPKRSQKELAEMIYAMAVTATEVIQHWCGVLSSPHSSHQQAMEGYRLLGFVGTDNQIISSHLQNSFPKKDNTCLLETGTSAGTSSHPSALPNSLELMCLSMTPSSKCNQRRLSLFLRCTKKGGNCNLKNCSEALKSGNAKVDEEWYLLWQVMRVVHTLSMHCVSWSDFEHYSFDKLCRVVGVKSKAAEVMLGVKMSKPYKNFYHNTETTIDAAPIHNDIRSLVSEPKLKASLHTVTKEMRLKDNAALAPFKNKKKLSYDGKDGSLPPSWRLEHVPRKNSRHVDRYWFSATNKKFRSRVEVAMFLDLIQRFDGDEAAAWEKFPGSRKKYQTKVKK